MGNPTDSLLILACIRVEEETIALVEIFQRPNAGPTTQRGYLRFLVQMCELGGDYFKTRRLRAYHQRQYLWERLELFLRAIHRSLDTRDTAYAIANESRGLIDADRVTVATLVGRRCVVTAISGLDAIDRRAEEVKRLAHLASMVVAADEPMWYFGDSSSFPPQLEKALDAYVDHSHSTVIGVLPLLRPPTPGSTAEQRPVACGALIVELMRQRNFPDSLLERSEIVAEHASCALANATELERIFLLPVWRFLGRMRWRVRSNTWLKAVAATACLAAAGLALTSVRHELTLSARGKLIPTHQYEVFAPSDGTVIDVPVQHGDPVQPGRILVRMRNSELEMEITDLIGRRTTTQEKVNTLERELLDMRVDEGQRNRLGGELIELRETLRSLERQLSLLHSKHEQLEIIAPRTGRVSTWQVRDKLMYRPVQRGEALLTVANPTGPWELELYVPEKHLGHISGAQREAGENLAVTFMLSSHPGQSFAGQIRQLH
ncbi:MAG: HlyD family efflux transporter periplasmic adaptor subunit, partial [Caldilineaceae bacterium]|nr:HlyD family efflux transporter periplasmic adaptor subunit [Caldilineaceae bacterium]